MPNPPSSLNLNGDGAGVDSSIIVQSDNARTPSKSRRCSILRQKRLLHIVGTLVGFLTAFSLFLGYYHNKRYTKELMSRFGSATSLIQIQLEQSKASFFGEDVKPSVKKDETFNASRAKKDLNNEEMHTAGLTHEREVFKSIIQRVISTEEQCSQIPENQRHTVKKEIKAATDLPPLPEGGVASALQNWMQQNDDNKQHNNEYPTCYLPPPKSCNVTTYTLIIMSHTTERLDAFMPQLDEMVQSWPGLTEIIIVWNSPRATLTFVAESSSPSKEKEYASQLLSWDAAQSHPLRIFFSLEEGLENNLLNRYHPKLQPINEVVMYFDDDGPFWSKEAMIDAGLELWKRNSNVQVGGFPRNVRFISDRMKNVEKIGLKASIDLIVKDEHSGENYPDFTPLCRNVTGDTVEYNYFVFPDFAAHMLLPSGSFLHRNFLCFIWHPAFEELRQYVTSHKTMPDDMTVSTLVSHLAGRAPRTFPREVQATGTRRLSTEMRFIEDDDALQSRHTDQFHRRLLWKQKNWGNMREEAINSIVGYFGSIHAGTVGWCAGTSYMNSNRRGVPYVCKPEKPSLDLIPWLTKGGAGESQC